MILGSFCFFLLPSKCLPRSSKDSVGLLGLLRLWLVILCRCAGIPKHRIIILAIFIFTSSIGAST